MNQSFYERIGESVYRETLPNGLQVCVVPKPGYAKKYAFFATRYGGMDTRFRLDGILYTLLFAVVMVLFCQKTPAFAQLKGRALAILKRGGK